MSFLDAYERLAGDQLDAAIERTGWQGEDAFGFGSAIQYAHRSAQYDELLETVCRRMGHSLEGDAVFAECRNCGRCLDPECCPDF